MGYPGEEGLNAETDARTNRSPAPIDLEVGDQADLARLRAIWADMPRIPVLLADRTQGADVSFGGLNVRRLLAGEQSAGQFCYHSLILPPGASIPAHAFDAGLTCWWVVRGTATLTVGAKTAPALERAFAFVPAQTTQAVVNASDTDLELIVAHSPAGLERGFAAAHARSQAGRTFADFVQVLAPYGLALTLGQTMPGDARVNLSSPRLDGECDSEDDYRQLRQRWARLTPTAKVVATPAEARKIAISDDGVFIMASPEETGCAVSAFINVITDGWQTGNHHQPEEDEMFIVFDGPMFVRIGNVTTFTAERGAFAYAPRFATHNFGGLEAGKGITMYSLNAPGGHERGFELAERIGKVPELFEKIPNYGFHFHLGDMHGLPS